MSRLNLDYQHFFHDFAVTVLLKKPLINVFHGVLSVICGVSSVRPLTSVQVVVSVVLFAYSSQAAAFLAVLRSPL